MDGTKAWVTRSLQVHLSVAASVVILFLAVAAGTLSFVEAYADAGEIQDQQLQAISQTFGLHGLALPQEPPKPRKLDGLHSASRIVIEPLGAGDGWLFRLPTDMADGHHTISVNGESWRIYVRTMGKSRTRFAVGQRTSIVEHIAEDALGWTALPLLALVPILCGLIYFLTRRALSPVVSLAQDLNRRSATDLGLVSTSGLPLELHPIVAAVNGMIVRVRNSLSAQRRFISDAAHELRSPLAALSLQALNLEKARTLAEVSERLSPLRQGLARASALLEQLLALAHAHAQSDVRGASFPVADALRSVMEKALPFAAQKDIELVVERLEPVAAAAREIDLVLILRNVLDNAIRYSPAGSEVRIAVSAAAGAVQIGILDDGPGVPEAERERILEPFFRLRGGSESGTGLGLSIVKEVVQRLGGSLALRGADAHRLKGLDVRITLPVAAVRS